MNFEGNIPKPGSLQDKYEREVEAKLEAVEGVEFLADKTAVTLSSIEDLEVAGDLLGLLLNWVGNLAGEVDRLRAELEKQAP